MRNSVIVFTEYKWLVGEIGGKKRRFQTKTDSRVDGFVLQLAWLAHIARLIRVLALELLTKLYPLLLIKKVVSQGFRKVFKSSGHNSESTGRDIFWRRKAQCLSGGMLPQINF